MAAIGEYQRKQLASSVVGTPGVDTSTGQAFDSAAQGVGQVANATFNLAVRRKEAKDAAVTNESLLGLDIDMENAYRQHQQDFRDFQGLPRERADIFQKQAQQMMEDKIKNAPNDEVRRALLSAGTDMIASRTKRELAAADQNQGVIAFTKINSAQRMSEEEAARVGADNGMVFEDKVKRVDDLLNKYNGTLTAAETVLDVKQAQELRINGPAAVSKAFATGMLAKKPEELLYLLNTKGANGKTFFEGKMDPADIEKLRKDAQQSVENFKERREVDDLNANLDQVTGAFDLAKKGDSVAALAITETMKDGPLKNSMRQSILREGITEQDRLDKVYDLMTKFTTLSTDKTTGNKGKKKKGMKASYEELLAFQAEVVEAHATGDITDAQRNKYLTEFLPDLQKKVKENSMLIQAASSVDSETSWIVKAWRGITRVTRDKAEAVTIHEDFRKRLTLSKDFTPAGVNKALLASLKDHRINRFPKSIFLADNVNAVLDNDKSVTATGVQGRTGASVSGKVPTAVPRVVVETDTETKKKYRVVYGANNEIISETEL